MPDLTPAAELRAASAMLKAAASSAQEASPTPWTPDDPMDPELRWIALMDPTVGLLLAEWLEWMVRAVDGARVAIPAQALALARAINTPTEETP